MQAEITKVLALILYTCFFGFSALRDLRRQYILLFPDVISLFLFSLIYLVLDQRISMYAVLLSIFFLIPVLFKEAGFGDFLVSVTLIPFLDSYGKVLVFCVTMVLISLAIFMRKREEIPFLPVMFVSFITSVLLGQVF